MKRKNTPKTTKKGFDMMSIVNELKAPALVIAGMVAGKFVGDMADKALKVTRENGVATIDGADAGVKGYIVPGGQVVAGVAGMMLIKEEHVKMFSAGFAANGIYKGANMLAKKDILNGLGSGSMINNVPQNYYELPEYFPIPEVVPQTRINGELPIANY
jgi:hypothetical protein